MPHEETTHSTSNDRRSRRQFLAGLAAASAGLALGCADRRDMFAPLVRPRSDAQLVGAAADGGFDHVIVLMMENRSFDHMLGWVPGADGRQGGLRYVDHDGVQHTTHKLAPDFQGCGRADPDHSFEGGRIQFNDGACDGFLRSGDNDEYAIGYYRKTDLDFFANAMEDWTTADRYFCSILGPTFPNRFYQHSARTDRISNTLVQSFLPTIWDSLANAGLTGRYYFSDLPFVALWGAKYQSITQPIDAFFADAAAGTLPNLSFIDPKFGGEEEGTSNDDHPHADVRAGQHFMHQLYTAITNGPAWERTVFVINYDEWGGFFDHVPPPIRPVSPEDVTAGNTDGRLGFRTPLLVMSPFARKKYVAHEVYDHTSILKMVEERWGLPSLSARDAGANSLANVLDFTQEPRSAPQYPVPPIAAGTACPVTSVVASASASLSVPRGESGVATSASRQAAWSGLREVASRNGF
ncbi:MAG TPA: alkaline phosphatase family protein [Gemmatimonadaceae bacterium]